MKRPTPANGKTTCRRGVRKGREEGNQPDKGKPAEERRKGKGEGEKGNQPGIRR
jgi:hypothetical protein